MDLITKAPRGTQDILPMDIYKWKFLEQLMMDEAEKYGYKEIRTPVFEHTELFKRSVGASTDVVQKEMYTFKDKSDRSITLRPEGTAGVVRAMIQNSLYNGVLPIKLSYLTSCYRYEKPQAGRFREFHQFGLESFGSSYPIADAELISIVYSIFKRLNLNNISLEINSIGCPTCRKKYYEELRYYLDKNKSKLCSTCVQRLEKNPMRILDCKNKDCKDTVKNAPTVLEYLCKDCAEHFEEVKRNLTQLKIKYKVNPKIVRGLDYYTKTVFEFVSEEFGAQAVICGGGRYDGLVEQISGKNMPALGFGMGIERLISLLDSQGIELPKQPNSDVYVASIGDKAKIKALELTNILRDSGFKVECDVMGRTIKSQMKYADKINVKYSIAIGEDEMNTGIAYLKNMDNGNKRQVNILDNFVASFFNAHLDLEAEEQKLK